FEETPLLVPTSALLVLRRPQPIRLRSLTRRIGGAALLQLEATLLFFAVALLLFETMLLFSAPAQLCLDPSLFRFRPAALFLFLPAPFCFLPALFCLGPAPLVRLVRAAHFGQRIGDQLGGL